MPEHIGQVTNQSELKAVQHVQQLKNTPTKTLHPTEKIKQPKGAPETVHCVQTMKRALLVCTATNVSSLHAMCMNLQSMLNEFSMKYSEQGIIFINYNQALKM